MTDAQRMSSWPLSQCCQAPMVYREPETGLFVDARSLNDDGLQFVLARRPMDIKCRECNRVATVT